MAIAVLFLLPTTARAYSLDASSIIELVNSERIHQSLESLKTDDALTSLATQKAHAIMANQEFSHTQKGQPFFRLLDDAGYAYEFAGENLAIDYYNEAEAVAAFMDSETHRANILDKRYTHTGVAVLDGVLDKRYTIVIVQLFSKPRTAVSGSVTPTTQFPSPIRSSLTYQGIAYAALATVLFVVRRGHGGHGISGSPA